MIPEIGHFSLLIAFVFSICLAIFPMIGAQKRIADLIALGKPLVHANFVLLSVSLFCLAWSFYHNDFSVYYVAMNSNSELPWYYRLSAVWGAHEGSLLLWVWILALWTSAVAIFSRTLDDDDVARVLAVMGFISIGFLAFVIFTSNPFERTFPNFPIDGRDLNPLLQDIGLIIHPPMLYMGYVGFSVAFAFAVAALISGKLDATWARWSRPWTLAAWIFLTAGITLGSWWAYYELGWGGWWFWDPVENASFMPWLAGTALIHSLAVTEKRGAFKSWTVLLAISAFSLSLLGTFLVRSGILVSVHAFASDPTRGLFILIYLLLVIGGALTLYAIRASNVVSTHRYKLFSREVFLFSNNILLVVALVVVLLGTLLPLVHKEIGLGSISIGAPFFDRIAALWYLPFCLLLGVAPFVRWKQDKLSRLTGKLVSGLVIALLTGLTFYLALEIDSVVTMTAVVLAGWVAGLTLLELVKNKQILKISLSHWGMIFGHLGFAALVLGIAVTQWGTVEQDVRMKVGEQVVLNDYTFKLEAVDFVKGPNYSAYHAKFDIAQGDKQFDLQAEKRYYNVQSNVMTEAGIDASLARDLYVALGEQLQDGAWAVRVYVKPFVRWIWLGGLLMSIGGLLCIADKRYRKILSAKALNKPVGSQDETQVKAAQEVQA
ncbi:heme lyase CcmF/NrfE family subunit [Catenovulum maritimum]|uniref:Cytochrome C biogenesis protein CcmF n=1 Tax=Catenovulum maritimum TaxID=1513271 RepID=A0A0J8GUA0_9ALTE|nr:heme lyase CcmF/NrfE family subunit [Catenovulum maritimum]KMT66345.1 cytochrome C biogenesis protein CcmF [Catenovulum maritimum]